MAQKPNTYLPYTTVMITTTSSTTRRIASMLI